MAIGSNPGGGLSTADKKTVNDWMIEGHSVQAGRVVGRFPIGDIKPENIVEGKRILNVDGTYMFRGWIPVMYGYSNGEGYSNVSYTGISLDSRYSSDSGTLKKEGYYKLIYSSIGRGSPFVRCPWGNLGGSGTKEGTLSSGEAFGGYIGSSEGNGNGSGSSMFILLRKNDTLAY